MECNETSNSGLFRIVFCLLGMLLLLSASPAMAQIGAEENSHRQELKYALQEAREVESVYKQTHLNLENRNFKRGEASRKQVKGKANRDYFKNTKRKGANSRIKLFATRNKSKP